MRNLEVLSDRDVAFYREQGYLMVPEVLARDELATLRAVTDELLGRARFMTESDDVLELDRGHRPEAPRIRRIKAAARAHPFYRRVLSLPRVQGVLVDLLGPAYRLLGGKVNIKAARHGTAVEWHQDWAYYPHTNDDLLAIGLPLDDMGQENAPLLVIPGSHKGPIWDHTSGGIFCGGIDRVATGLDASKAVTVTAPAGAMTVHHVRTIHGSDLNRSDRPRRVLFHEVVAGDAWPLAYPGAADWARMRADMVLGEPSLTPRMTAVPVRMPLPEAPAHADTLYAKQDYLANPSFARAEAAR
jgi:ectoine hydroxylase-related dioxygenase (phytanoyl-CoA dioxygenase family)